MSIHVSSLSLQAYLQLVEALTDAGAASGSTSTAAARAAASQGTTTPTTTTVVRPVSAIEEHFFRVQDLRKLLMVQGLASGKLVRGDLLRGMVGASLLHPLVAPPAASPAAAAETAATGAPPSSSQQQQQQQQQIEPLKAAELMALGWAAGLVEALQAELASAPTLSVPEVPLDAPAAVGAGAPIPAAPEVPLQGAAGAPVTDHSSGPLVSAPPPPPPRTSGVPQQQASVTPEPAAAHAAPAAPAAASGAPPALDASALLALLQQHGLLPAGVLPQALQPPAAQPQPMAAAAAAGQSASQQQQQQQTPEEQQGTVAPEPEHAHTQWLRRQLAIFEGLPGCRASEEPLPVESRGAAAAPLAGRRVAFVLDREMAVAPARRGEPEQMLPAGVFQGRAVRFLGTACRPALCEPTCPGDHQFYRAKIIPPPPGALAAMAAAAAATPTAPAATGAAPVVSGAAAPPAAAAGASSVRTGGSPDYAAALGRPIELELDLHPRLRQQTAQELLLLDAEALQDAWVLLEQQEVQQQPEEGVGTGATEGSGVVRPQAKRGRRS